MQSSSYVVRRYIAACYPDLGVGVTDAFAMTPWALATMWGLLCAIEGGSATMEAMNGF